MLERLLLRLDEQGLALSSPWPQREGKLIAAAEKQKWGRLPRDGGRVGNTVAACQTLSLCMLKTWQSTNLNSAAGLWLHIDDLQHNHRLLSADEYASLTSWLDAAEPSSAEEIVSDDLTPTRASESTPKEWHAQLVLG